MKTFARVCSLLCLTLAPLPALHAQQASPQNAAPPAALPAIPPLEQKFRDGLYAEEATQDLDTAVKAYAEIIAAFDRDRATAAAALFRLGEVHRKQNRPADAIASFRRLLQEFPDREPLARLAAENLKALGATLPEGGRAPAGVSAPDITVEESSELARLQGLLKNSPDLLHSKTGGPDGKGVSAFLAALRAGHLKVAEFLLANGADPNRTPEGSNPLADASLGGHKALVELLLARGADLNGTGSGAVNPVFSAILGDAATVLKLLIERGADLKKADAVIQAVNRNKSAILKLILDSGADPNSGIAGQKRRDGPNQSTLIGLGKYQGFIGGSKGTAPEELTEGYTPLQAACALRNPANAALLLEKGADVNAKSALGSTALELAVITSQPELAELLLKAGADAKHIAPGGLRLTDLAAAARHIPLYQLLRKAGAEVTGLNPAGQSIWQILAPPLAQGQEGTDAIAAALLADGAEFNSLPDDANPLVIAVRRGNLALTKLCLLHGGDAKRQGRSPLLLELIFGSTERNYKSTSGVSQNAPDQGWDLFPGDEIAILRTLLEAGADLNAVNQAPTGNSGFSGLTAFHAVAQLAKELSVASLEKFLAFHPDPHIRSAVSLENAGPAVTANELISNYGYLSRPPTPSQQRLWDYTWLENTPERSRSAWINRPAFGIQNTSVAGTFSSVPPGTIAEVIVQHFRKDGYLPDPAKLAIHRFDPATGKTSQTEPLDLMALASQRPSAELPKLNPGDIVDLPVQKIESITSWRELPAPLPDFLRQATTRRITLTAGEWKRTFQVRPPLEGFRWDPSTDVLSVEPTLASILRFTPQPEFTYRMNAVTLKRAGEEEPQLLDPEKSPDSFQKPTLTDGDEIILTSIPADDPALKERMAQGIFVSRAKDGFLREVLRNTGAPPGIENKVTVDDIREMSLTASDWVLPKPVRDPILHGETGPPNGPLLWGQTLEMPRDMEAEGIPWTGSAPERPADLPMVTVIRRDSESFPLALYRGNSIFQLEEDGWSVRYSAGPNMSISNPSVNSAPAWYIKSRSLAALADEIAPDKSKRGVWELQSSRLKQPVRLDLRGKEPPFILLEHNDTLMVEREEPLLDLKPSNGTDPNRPSVSTPQGPPPPRRRMVVLPPSGQ